MNPDRKNVLVASLLKRPRLWAAGLVDCPLAIAILLRNEYHAKVGSFAENLIDEDVEFFPQSCSEKKSW